MRIRGIIEEDFVQYKKPSMFLISCFCDWKCCNELGLNKKICQNSTIKSEIIDVNDKDIVQRYLKNDITKSIVIGGLEPCLQPIEIYDLLREFRTCGCHDDFVIYTGYNKSEIIGFVNRMADFDNVIIKFGRYIPSDKEHYDKILGVNLASKNQYGERIS